MNITFSSGNSRFIPPEIWIRISVATRRDQQPWMIGGCCDGDWRPGPGSHLGSRCCGPVPDDLACPPVPAAALLALSSTCRILRRILRPLCCAALRVKLVHGLYSDNGQHMQIDRETGLLVPPEVLVVRSGYHPCRGQITRQLPVRVCGVQDLPFQSDMDERNMVQRLAIEAQSWVAYGNILGPTLWEPDVYDGAIVEQICDRHVGIGYVLDAFPNVRDLFLWMRFSLYGGPNMLPLPAIAALSSFRHLTVLRLHQIRLPASVPLMPSLERMETQDSIIDCFSSFPRLRDLRMWPSLPFGDGYRIPYGLLYQLEHFTYSPPDNIDEATWLPGECTVRHFYLFSAQDLIRVAVPGLRDKQISPKFFHASQFVLCRHLATAWWLTLRDQKLAQEQRDSEVPVELPLKEFIINGAIHISQLLSIIEGLSTPKLHTFICWGLAGRSSVWKTNQYEVAQTAIFAAFPNLTADRMVLQKNVDEDPELGPQW